MKRGLLRVLQAACARGPAARWVLWRAGRGVPRVALTFDDGPRVPYTREVLAILREAGVKATFFVEGHRVAAHAELAGEVAAAGHEIGNHGYEHGDGSSVADQRARCARILAGHGWTTRLFRPPLGIIGAAELLAAAARGYRTVFWSFDARDSMRHEGKWGGPPPDYRQVRAGDILLMHDDNPVCVAELPRLLEILAQKGLRPVTVSELMGWSATAEGNYETRERTRKWGVGLY